MQIEKNIPLPTPALKGNEIYPWLQMTEVGDSFLAGPTQAMEKIRTSCRKRNKRHPETEYLCAEDPAGNGVRVWRLK